MSMAFNAGLPGIGTNIISVKKWVKMATEGTLRIKTYGPGKLMAPFEILDAVAMGKVPAGYSISGHWKGKIPAAAIFSSLPFVLIKIWQRIKALSKNV